MKKGLFLVMLLLAFCNECMPQTFLPNGSFQSSLVEPKCIVKVGDGHYFMDFGKAAFGTLWLTTKSHQKDVLVVHLGEKTVGANAIDRKPGGSIRYQEVRVSDIPLGKGYLLKLPPNKRNTNPPAVSLPDSFGVIMPFRYCELENLKIPISDLIVRQKVYNYRFNDKSSNFKCSDSVLNKVWDMCKYTIKATSFCGLYIDGDRERTPYEADAYINQLGHYCVDDEYSLARNTNEYFMCHPTWPTEWILQTVLLFYNDYLYTGNIESISRNYEALKSKTLIDLERKDGLISTKSAQLTDSVMIKLGFKNAGQRISDIVDWPGAERDGYEMTGVNTVVNSFHYISLKRMSEIAGFLGKKEDSVAFYERSVIVKNAINQKLFDKEKGVYVDGEASTHSSLHANMFPLAFGIVPDEYRGKVVSFVKSRGMACSVYGAQFLLEALYQEGEADYALGLMTSKSDRGWWNMIKSGSTMALEAWDMKYKTNLDWSHAWGTAPANIVTRYMWGITPTHPGYTKVQIKPQLGKLTSAKIKVPTIIGPIRAEYKLLKNKDRLFDIELPEGMAGEFVLPVDNQSKIFVNGKPHKTKSGFVPVKSGLNHIEIKK